MADLPVIQPEPEPELTNNAQLEAARFAARDLQRGDSVRAHIHRGGLCVFWVSVFLLLSLLLVWTWHLVTPDSWHFLNAEGRDRLQTILVSILGSTFVSGAARRWINTPQQQGTPSLPSPPSRDGTST